MTEPRSSRRLDVKNRDGGAVMMFTRLAPGLLLAASMVVACASGEPERGKPLLPPEGVEVDRALCLATSLPGVYSGESPELRARKLKFIVDAGVNMLRWDFRWSIIERQKGKFNFEPYDRIVDDAAAAGVSWIGVLAYGNPWATSATTDDDKYPPDDPADFAAFARRIADHFKGRISHWEIWNEQNAGYRFWRPEADAAAYSSLLAAAYEAVHEVAADARVAFGGTFFAPQYIPGSIEFVRDCYEYMPELGNYFDAMAFHPYMIYPPSVPPESDESLPPFEDLQQRTLAQMISDMRTVLYDNQDGDKPIWITEIGWPEFESVSAIQQARYLVRSYLIAMASGVERICWYTLEDSTGHAVSFEDAFGLIPYDPDPTDGADLEPKPGYYALQTLSKTLAGTRFDRDLASETNQPRDIHLLRFATKDRHRQVLVTWSHGESRQLELQTSSFDYVFTRIVSMTGQEEPLGSRSVFLEVGRDVNYLVEEIERP